MLHEIDELKLEIYDSNLTFENIFEKEYFPQYLLEEIYEANMLLIPDEMSRESGSIVFPETTLEFYDFLKGNANEGLIPEIAIDDDNFQRLELHSAVITIASFIVKEVVVPIAIGLVTSYLYDQLKKYNRKDDEIAAKINMIVTNDKTSKRISYEGPVSEVKDSLENAINNMFVSENDEN